MKIVQTSDYMIFFDDVRVDPYIITWNSWIGLFASEANASITMYRTDEMDNWKPYLTQVKIFSKNIFTGKFGMVFEGEISGRSWGQSRSNIGKVVFSIKGFYHWLDLPIPLKISTDEAMDQLQRFIYEAQNMNVSELQSIVTAKSEILMKDKTIEEVIYYLFEQINKGYYDVAKENSTFGWAKMKERFKVMSDVLREFREAGFMDLFTFVKGTQIETFYVYLNEVLSQLMFEFYQDRDGTLRVKTPSWSENILKTHILDESFVQEVSGADNWTEEPTRVLVIGGTSELLKQAANGSSAAADGYGAVANIPVGLYIGDPKDGEYYSSVLEAYTRDYGVGLEDIPGLDGSISTETWFDNITGQYQITSGHRSVNKKRPDHHGTDYGMRYDKLYNIGTTGKVLAAKPNNDPGGKRIYIQETINGVIYEFRYMHLEEMYVKEGDTVTPGQLIGKTGNTDGGTGVSSGPHLHLEIWKGGRNAGNDLNSVAFLKEQKEIAEKQSSGKASASTSNFGSGTDAKSKFFARMKPYAITASNATNVPFEVILAQWGLESSYGDSDLCKRALNFAGIKYYSGADFKSKAYAGFNSLDAWTKGYVRTLKLSYYDKVRSAGSVEAAAKALAASPWAEDPSYGDKLMSVIKKYGGEGTYSSPTLSEPSTSNPFASVGGTNPFSLTTGSGTSLTLKKSKTPAKSGMSDVSDLKPVLYNQFGALKYSLPYTAGEFKKAILNKPNGIDFNLLCCMIGETSGWREKYSTDTHVGLLPISREYANAVLPNKDLKNGLNTIEYGTAFFAECMARFQNKVTFALAAYWTGNMSEIEDSSKKANGLNFTKARDFISKDALTFVDKVIDEYVLLLGGDYIQGDPHKSYMGDLMNPAGDKVITPPSSGDGLPDYDSAYQPIMSEEELKYKINLKTVEQQLIRNDSEAIKTDVLGAQELVYRYAKYIMQIYRAQAHTVNVSLATSMPFLRPGFNAWLEPSRTDVVFYTTGVGHQGSFGQGTSTSVRGSFVRSPKDFNDIDQSIFIGERNVEVEDFGPTIAPDDMEEMRKKLVELNNDDSEVVEDAQNIKVLSDLYTVGVSDNLDYVTEWNQEYTADEIEAKLTKIYADAPEIIKKRSEEIKKIIEASETKFLALLFKTSF